LKGKRDAWGGKRKGREGKAFIIFLRDTKEEKKEKKEGGAFQKIAVLEGVREVERKEWGRRRYSLSLYSFDKAERGKKGGKKNQGP